MSSTFKNIPGEGNLIVASSIDLPLSAESGALATTADTAEVYVFDGATWQLRGAVAGSGILTINSQNGTAQTLATGSSGTAPAFNSSSNIHTLDIPLSSGVGVTSGTISKTDYDKFDDASDLVLFGVGNRLAIFDAGELSSSSTISNNSFNDLDKSLILEPDNGGGASLSSNSYSIEPLQNSPDNNYSLVNNFVDIDPDDSGYTIGTNGNLIRVVTNQITHEGTSNIGEINFTNNNLILGNGTDPIDVNGVSYSYGFGTISDNVTVQGPLQGYGFQISTEANSEMNSYVTAFYDSANIQSTNGTQTYTSISLSPSINAIKNNSNYTGINLNPIVDNFLGNSGFTGLNITGTLGNGSMTNGSVNGININTSIGEINGSSSVNIIPSAIELNNYNGIYVKPNINLLNSYAAGLFIDMSDVTGFAGTQSVLTIQDLTYTFNAAGDNNSYTIEYLDDTTAGSENVTISGTDVSVHMESSVSTATQIKTAVDATIGLNAAITVTISGVGSNPQISTSPANFTSGSNSATARAIDVVGDVNIQGNLAFTGAISLGQINAFDQQALVDGGGTPSSVHSLISGMTAANNAVIANADTIGVNTASLINIGSNANITTAFLGLSALALPAVLTIGNGASVDRISGATFAVSMDAGGGTGTINELALCKALGLPNGVTVVNRLYGYEMASPFGAVGTDEWGIYISPSIPNWLKGSLRIGGTAVSDDKVTNSSVGLELASTTQAMRVSNMSETERDALTALNGMIIYNTTNNKLQAYANGSWVDLH